MPNEADTPPILLTGGTLWNGTGNAPINEAFVLMQNGRISYAGQRPIRRFSAPDVRRIDVRGKWIVPGLIDLHVHLDEVISPGAFVLFGVTSVRDVGSRLATIQEWRSVPGKGEVAPRIFWMGQNIDEGKPSWSGAVAVPDARAVPALLHAMAEQGVDGVKLYVNARPDVTRAVIAEAHRRHWPVTGHLAQTLPSEAARAGIDNLEHVFTLFNEIAPARGSYPEGMKRAFARAAASDPNGNIATHLIRTLCANHVALTPTLTVSALPYLPETEATQGYAGWADVPNGWRTYWRDAYWSFLQPTGWTEADRAMAQNGVRNLQRLVGRLEASNVSIVAGTDTPAPWVLPGAGLIRELELLVESGLTPRSALLAATGRAARILRREGSVGTITSGAHADVLVLDRDPLRDIRALRHLQRVFQNGREVDRKTLRTAFETTPAPPPQKPAA